MLPPELWIGLAIGAVIAVPLALLSRWIPWLGSQLGLLGLAAAFAGLFAVQLQPPPAVALGAALFVLVGSLRGRLMFIILAAPIVAAGAVLIAEHSDGSVGVAIIVGTVAGVGALVASDFDRRSPLSELGPLMALVSAGGIFLSIPDTERAATVVGALVPITAVAFVAARPRLGPGGSGLVALLAWVVASGGHSRPAAVVGGLASLGFLMLEPILRSTSRSRPLMDTSSILRLAIGAHIAFVLVVARGAAQWGNVVVALVLVTLATMFMAALYKRRFVIVSGVMQ